VIDFVARRLPTDISKNHSVVEFGSRDVNGTIRPLLGAAQYVGVDIEPGPNVDIVMDAKRYDGPADFVLCLETLEHCDGLDDFVDAIVRNVKPKGRALITAATTGRRPHSAIDGEQLREGEYYENVTCEALEAAVAKTRGQIHYKEIDTIVGDIRVEIHVD